jgi:hypothetical protein
MRPLIWGTPADRAPILAKIAAQPWAKALFAALQGGIDCGVLFFLTEDKAYAACAAWFVRAGFPHLGWSRRGRLVLSHSKKGKKAS